MVDFIIQVQSAMLPFVCTGNRTASALFEVKLSSMPGLPVCQ